MRMSGRLEYIALYLSVIAPPTMKECLKLGSIKMCCCGWALFVQIIKVFVMLFVQYCLLSVTFRR